MKRYRAYGLEIESDIALPELQSRTGPDARSVSICAAEVPVSGLHAPDFSGPYAQTKAGEVWLNIPSVARLHIRHGRYIDYHRDDGVEDALLRAFLLGSGLGAILIQRDYIVLHGNAVEIGDGCLICVGVSGAGKSTTATGFLQRGYRVVADDVCPIDDRARVIPGMPHIKVWQKTADALGVSTEGLPRVALQDDKFRMPLNEAFAGDPLPLRVLVELCPRDAPGVEIEPVSGLEKIAMVRRNLYRPEYVNGMGMQAPVFQRLARQISGVRAFRAHRSRSGFQLDALLDALLEKCTHGPLGS